MRSRLGNNSVLPTSKKINLILASMISMHDLQPLTFGPTTATYLYYHAWPRGFRAVTTPECIKLTNRRSIRRSRAHGSIASCRPLAPAPAVLQRPGDGTLSPALEAPPRPERLLRNGQVARRVPAGASDVQSGAIPDHANSGLCFWRGAGSFFAGCCKTGKGSDGAGAAVCAAIFVSGASGECNRALSALSRAVGEISQRGRISRAGREVFQRAGFHRLAGAVANWLVR